MIDSASAALAVRRARQLYPDFADLFLERTTTMLCNVVQGELRAAYGRVEQGAAMRRLNETYCIHVHVPDCSEAGLAKLVQALEHGRVPEDALQSQEQTFHADEAPELGQLIAVTREAADEVAAMQTGMGEALRLHATVMSHVRQQEICLVRPDGCVRHETRYSAHLRVEAVARQERKVRNGRRGIGATCAAGLADQNRHRQVARQAAEAALTRLEAIDTPVGEMPVILGPGGPAALLHEVCGHPLEADIAHCPGSAYYGRQGERIASSLLTLIDDPNVPEAMPMYRFDDEGEPARPTVLIERGRLLTHLYDRRTARAVGQISNGHARRLHYAYPPMPRMSTTYVLPGESSPEEIIAETPYGIFVQSINGGDTSIRGRFNLMVEEGYLIEHGRITAPLRGAILSGHAPTALQTIDRVGNDSAFFCHGYTCNKLDQYPLPVSLGQPTLRVGKLLVWGG